MLKLHFRQGLRALHESPSFVSAQVLSVMSPIDRPDLMIYAGPRRTSKRSSHEVGGLSPARMSFRRTASLKLQALSILFDVLSADTRPDGPCRLPKTE